MKQTGGGGGGGEEGELSVPPCVPPLEDPFKGDLDTAVSQYLSHVKDLGYREQEETKKEAAGGGKAAEGKDHSLLAVRFQLHPEEIKPKDEDEVIEDEEVETETEAGDNPLYLTLSQCSSGLDLHHFYENGLVGREEEHIYENVENSTGEEEEEEERQGEHVYDTLPRHKPHVPPKPDFLSQLAARQSEPIKRAWSPFVALSVDTNHPTPPSTSDSSLSSPDSAHTPPATTPFLPRGTLILEGSETSDLGSSGGEYDVGSVEDWPLPPTPPPGEDELINKGDPLPPPPPEIALQQLEEEVLRLEEQERKIIERRLKDTSPHQESGQVEAVNTRLASLQHKARKEPRIIQVEDEESEDCETPAIRHSVIIELKDSCPSVPHSIKPSDIRRRDGGPRRSHSLKTTSVFRKSSAPGKVTRRESLSNIFPSLQDQLSRIHTPDAVSKTKLTDEKLTESRLTDKKLTNTKLPTDTRSPVSTFANRKLPSTPLTNPELPIFTDKIFLPPPPLLDSELSTTPLTENSNLPTTTHIDSEELSAALFTESNKLPSTPPTDSELPTTPITDNSKRHTPPDPDAHLLPISPLTDTLLPLDTCTDSILNPLEVTGAKLSAPKVPKAKKSNPKRPSYKLIAPKITAPKKESTGNFSFLDPLEDKLDRVIEISEDGSWAMKETAMDADATVVQVAQPDIDPFTGKPIAVPPLSPASIAAPTPSPDVIAAPPSEFQTYDGMDGVYMANVISTHSGPSSLASTAPDSLMGFDLSHAEAQHNANAPETILEEPMMPDFPSNDCELKSLTHRNLGAAIMEEYEMELQKKKDSMNLPEHSLLEFGDTVRDLEEQRRSVIKQMTVKAKRKDTWIKTFNMHDQGGVLALPVAPSRSRRKNSPTRPDHDLIHDPAPITYLPRIILQKEPETSLKEIVESVPVIPMKSSRKKKKPVEPQLQQQAPPEAKEPVISPKNTEILAAMFSSPTRTSEEQKTSSPKKTKTIDSPIESPRVKPPVVPDIQSTVEASAAKLASSPVKPSMSFPLESSKEDAIVREKNEINRVHSVPPSVPPPLPPTLESSEEEEVEVKQDVPHTSVPAINFIPTPVNDPISAPPTDPISAPATDSISAPPTDPISAPAVDPIPILFADLIPPCATDPISAPAINPITTPAVDPVSAPAIDSIPAPAVDSIPTPAIDSIPTPAINSIPTPATDPISAPAIAPISAPAIAPISAPANSPISAPANSPISAPDIAPIPILPADPISPPATDPIPVTPPCLTTTHPPATSPPSATTPAPATTATNPDQAFQDAEFQLLNDEGEVEYFSILDNKVATKTYWEARMLANMDDGGGWESVANVRFQALQNQNGGGAQQPVPVENGETQPAPEFLPAPPPQFDNSPTLSEESCPPSLDAPSAPCPSKQYVYGVTEVQPNKDLRGVRVVETVAKRSVTQETIIEAEIRAQQVREEQLAGRDKGATSPHDSDEGFVDRDDPPALPRPAAPAPPAPPYTHAIPGADGQPVIYDAVSPPPLFVPESTPTPPATSNTTESKIALEIRELKEREDELRRMREQLLAASSRDTLLEEEEEEGREDHLASLTTTTDEGNFSECGDPASSSEDKSSDGSNSRMMSPDLHHPAGPPSTHLDFNRRKVTVKPYQDDEEDQPVYPRMQKESVIEREIRLSREREEAYRREKGITSSYSNSARSSSVAQRAQAPTQASTDGRDVQHRLATSRIQLEIQETSTKERELKNAGKIITLSEETVDAKLARGFGEKYIVFEKPVRSRRRNFIKKDKPTNGAGVLAVVVQRESLARIKPAAEQNGEPEQQKQQYRRSYCTAEEKIQSELKEMQMREEELRRLRARQLAQSQPNLVDLCHGDDIEDHHQGEGEEEEEEEDLQSFQEMNGLRAAISNPNLLDQPDHSQVADKGMRRRSALIAQWENRIQQTTDT